MRVAKWLVATAITAAVVIAVLYWVRQTVQVSWSHCVQAEFLSLPKEDLALKEWLMSQPGIVPHTVTIRRFGPESRHLEIGFIQVRNLAGSPPFPNLEGECRMLGYGGMIATFRDCQDR